MTDTKFPFTGAEKAPDPEARGSLLGTDSESLEALKKVKGMLEEGKTLFAVKAWFDNYSGSLVDGHTRHILMTPESTPKFQLTPNENKVLGLIEEIEALWEKDVVTERWDTPHAVKGFTVYISERPFKVWIRHRGHTGDRCDDQDEIVESKPIKTIFELLQMLEEEPS